MATTETPYGLRPVNILGGQPNSHAFRQYPIASGYATDIFTGDLVKLVVGGTIEKAGITDGSAGDTDAPVGVFMGVSYSEPTFNYFIQKQMWEASTVTSDAVAYVLDDPDALFEIQADGTLGQNAVGTNAAVVQGTGNDATGVSGVQLSASSIAGTATLPLRIVDAVDKEGFSVLDDAFTDVIVRINTHFNRTAAGNAGS